jgi:hypothetical protein
MNRVQVLHMGNCKKPETINDKLHKASRHLFPKLHRVNKYAQNSHIFQKIAWENRQSAEVLCVYE